MAATSKLKTQCPFCGQKIRPYSVANFVKICPICLHRIG